MPREDKEMDEELFGLICSLERLPFKWRIGVAQPALSVRDHNGIGLGVTPPYRSFILLATLSACVETKDLCSTAAYQINAKVRASHSKHHRG